MWTLKKTDPVPVNFPPSVTFANVFTREECEEIIKIGQELFPREMAVLENQETRNPIRKGHVSWFRTDETKIHWIYQRLNTGINVVNQGNWGFDLDSIEALQFTIYDELADNYDSHIDMLGTNQSNSFRKLSFSIQLTEENSYEGCNLDLFIGPEPITAPRGQGSITFFPSVLLHRVTPITRGQRYSLVGWVTGPSLR